ncbi:aromatic ring-hydroxylating dioxygenase subunit alpha [Prosthecodimorpha staleyi]|uniref:Aromatic ring-hydroxylating dioxygenase subunit alpha n=1 Tax=Prosthecodimorpha staleyi TaxID=2840188 RepID=A0A947D1G3_9HYPH|nr:aromatic ring-hydroxylating dioxygenase subunit alpha [Prosthecodimorpha staleyi]MBT9288518.1 aromatic ring-hydroxylating dioxygenase subunit alpha [Prosthecodimorpha staleyi]
MFLRDCWYVAGWSRDIGEALTPVRILGDAIVLFRKADGTVAALEDACPHRKLPLSMGRREGDRVVCGYHGMTFDAGGGCVATPTQERIPSGARVRSYPTLERYGFVWIWTGAAERADPAKLIDIPHYDDPTWGRTAGGDMAIACNYLYITDNLLDPSHVAWVHLSSFAGAKTDSTPLRTDVTETGVVVWRWMMDTEPPAYYKPLVKFEGNADRKQHYECVVPSIAINKSIFAPAGHGGPDAPLHEKTYINISYNFMTPVDESHSHYYWFQHRNTDPENQEISESMNRGAYGAFTEDKDVLEAVQIGMANKKTPHLDLALDAGALRFRKLVAARIAAETAAPARAAEPVGA